MAILIVVIAIAGLPIWWRSGWAMPPSFERPFRNYFGCHALWESLLMISGATEGVPYTSIHIRGDLAQDVVGFTGLFLAIFGTYYGFWIGKVKKRLL